MSDVVLIELLKTIATVATSVGATIGAMLAHRRYRRYRREKESSAPPLESIEPSTSLEPPPFVSDRPTPVYPPARKRDKGTP